MFHAASLISFTLALAATAVAQTYTATYSPGNAPDKSEAGQVGTNKCGNGQDQNSMCQNVYVNSLDDWCLFAPPQPNSVIGETERIEVAWCIQGGHGTRVIPDESIQGAHFVQTPDYVQVTGIGDLTKINVRAGDEGGELDPHGADGNGNPIGGLVFSSAFGGMSQMHEWTNFMSSGEFCIRACKDGPQARKLCQHIYDVMGCFWNMPGDYSAGSFDACQGESGEPMGVYGTSTFFQGQPSTPPAHPAPPKSQCNKVNTIGNGIHVSIPPATTTQPTTMTTTTGAPTITTTSGQTTANTTTTGQTTASTTTSVSTTPSTSDTATLPTQTNTTTPQGTTTQKGTAPPAPTQSNTNTNTGSAAPTGGTSNGAASLFGRDRGVEAIIAGAVVVIGAVLAA